MRKRFEFFSIYAAFLLLGAMSVSAQSGVLSLEKQVDTRRGEISNPTPNFNKRDTIHGPKDVNVVFGAGESSMVKDTKVNWPATSNDVVGGTNPHSANSLMIGSYYSKNAVIGIYDQGGLSAGALHDIRLYGNNYNSPAPDAYNSTNVKYYEIKYLVSPADTNTVGAPVRSPAAYHCPGTLVTFIDGGYGGRGIEGHAVLEKTYNGVTAIGAVLRPYFNEATMKYIVPVYNHVSMETQAKWNAEVDKQTAFSFNVETADTVYTSTRKFKDAVNGNIDDGKPLLLQFKGEGTEDKFKTTLDKAEYIRPTTVLLSGTQSLNKITVGDIEWYAAFFKSTKIGTDIIGPFKGYNSQGCGHLSGWVAYQRDNYTFDTIRTENSKKYVDGAVRLLNNADVCVSGNVLDSTKTQYSIGTYTNTETKAMLVVPGAKDKENGFENFRLKVGGNFNMLVTQDSGRIYTNPLDAGYMYMASAGGVGPGAPFPSAQVPLKLSNGTTTWNEVQGLINYNHPRGSVLTDVNNADAEKRIPYFATKGSVFGVRGAYNGGKADGSGDGNIHTRNINDEDVKSIIEIGSATTNQDKFHIYSSGMLKNFRSGCNNVCETLVVGLNGKAPEFKITNDSMPLYIINDGTCCDAGIRFNGSGVTNLNTAITGAQGKGDLHIQAKKFIRFQEQPIAFTQAKENNVKVLSDNGYIYSEKDFAFTNADTAHLTLWARGIADAKRGCTELDCNTGAIQIDGNFNYEVAGAKGKSLLLMRSENDDVLVKGTFGFKNEAGTAESGEMMVQAGQDIRIDGDVTLEHDGLRSMLFEAKKTVAFGSKLDANITKTKTNGDLTIKAGYNSFLPNADNGTAIMRNWGTGTCVDDGYANREACQDNAKTGGDIWFKNAATFTLTPAASDSVDTYIRAYNSIHIDGDFTHTLTSKKGKLVDTTMLYAETGNIEAMNAGEVKFEVTNADDSVYLLLQAGNGLGNPCAPTNCFKNNQWDGNILFGSGKSLTIDQKGTGPTLISAARDIENQKEAPFTFNYTNTALGTKDSILITAGRHIETHAPYIFNYKDAGTDITNSITMQAGHLAGGCNWALCKVPESGSTLKNEDFTNNDFSNGGEGQGSILAFSSIDFNYDGKGLNLMTALNGNIESDPYLHGEYKGGAPITFNHGGTGVTRMEAIDIKLHDYLKYDAYQAANDSNGWFYMSAYDSILTRNITYKNPTDKGSVLITTDKLKMTGKDLCQESIRQGHIVLGYGADCKSENVHDTILFDLDGNPHTAGANIIIEAGVNGFNKRTDYKKRLYGGNITFDYMVIKPAVGNHTTGGFTKIYTPNGNIWGKDSITYTGHEGDLLIDAGLGSADDNDAIRWNANDKYGEGNAMQKNGTLGKITNGFPNGSENTLNTRIANNCAGTKEWRTGNIMIKGGSLTYPTNEGGHATIRTRAGYIDLYDKFDVTGMTGQLLIYAHSDEDDASSRTEYSDVSTRDFHYTPSPAGSSVYFGADDNIMLNYGNSNGSQDYTPDVPCAATGVYAYDYNGSRNKLHDAVNPFYSTAYKQNIKECHSIFNVNTNGYQWYNNASKPYVWKNGLHLLYRGGSRSCNPSGVAGMCETPSNGARDIILDFTTQNTGGFAAVANNYIDFFTKLSYNGGNGSGLERPSVGTLVGEDVAGYGLFIKSRYKGAEPERRRETCENCTPEEWPVVTFHDDARIHTENQETVIESPVVEFFGHTELDSYTKNDKNGKIIVRGDSLIFHDSVIFDGTKLELAPFTTDAATRASNFRYGIINDNKDNKFYVEYGMAIKMQDRGTPVLELGYQRCNEPSDGVNKSPNLNSKAGKEPDPMVGGDIIVAFKHDFALPIYNTVVANHARISFISDSLDGPGGEYIDAFIRTDLLRIRNKVEFYNGEGTGPNDPKNRRGWLNMSSYDYMYKVKEPGIFPNHLHMEPGSELSLPGEDSLLVNSTTTVGGYGNIHENVFVKANGTIAPGYASLMEEDCQTPHGQGRLTVHNLTMEKDAIFRISIGRYNQCYDSEGNPTGGMNCTAADVLKVEDSIFFNGKIPLHVLLEGSKDLDAVLDPGCYLFLEYNDSLGASKEYVKNLVLPIDRYQDNYFGLDYSTPGKVYLCVSQLPIPVINRYVKLPAVEGVKTTPEAGTYYVEGHKNFSFKAKFSGTPLKVTATGMYHGESIDLDNTATLLPDGSYLYTIMQIVQPYEVKIGPETSTIVGNDNIGSPLVYAYKNMLHINVDKSEIVSIYNMTGVLYRRIEVPAGNSKFTLDKGMYIVTLKDGSVHKIVIK